MLFARESDQRGSTRTKETKTKEQSHKCTLFSAYRYIYYYLFLSFFFPWSNVSKVSVANRRYILTSCLSNNCLFNIFKCFKFQVNAVLTFTFKCSRLADAFSQSDFIMWGKIARSRWILTEKICMYGGQQFLALCFLNTKSGG